MPSTITIEAKLLGKKTSVFDDWTVPFPDFERLSLRGLITQVVLEEVQTFRKRQAENRLARLLSPDDIARGATQGKIDAGGRDPQHAVDPQQAVATALQAFADGLYLVFIDGRQQLALDDEITLADNSHVMFVRLVALAGG